MINRLENTRDIICIGRLGGIRTFVQQSFYINQTLFSNTLQRHLHGHKLLHEFLNLTELNFVYCGCALSPPTQSMHCLSVYYL